MPAQVVEQLGFGFVAETLERSEEVVGFQLIAEPIDTAILQQVFHPGVATNPAVTVIPLQRHDRLEQIKDVCSIHVTEGIGDAGKGLFLVVGAAHATTHVHVAAPQIT